MYYLKAEASFDAAHFLARYDGKCRNIHGHHWVVHLRVCGETLQDTAQESGMLVDFSQLKADLKAIVEPLDHTLIYEAGTLRAQTHAALVRQARLGHEEGGDGRVGDAGGDVLRELGVRTAGFDFMWRDDDVDGQPLILEFSPLYQPNPPKPRRYDDWSYKRYKSDPYVADGYFAQQHLAFREIAGQVLDQGMI